MDHVTFEQAFLQLGRVIRLSEKPEEATGYCEITFASSGESAFIGSTQGYAQSASYANGWYSGDTVHVTGNATTQWSSTTTAAPLTWQNSTMMVVLKDPEGHRLWTADYNYKGGWELSGWSVNTAQEAAKLCIKRVTARLKSELNGEGKKPESQSHFAPKNERGEN